MFPFLFMDLNKLFTLLYLFKGLLLSKYNNNKKKLKENYSNNSYNSNNNNNSNIDNSNNNNNSSNNNINSNDNNKTTTTTTTTMEENISIYFPFQSSNIGYVVKNFTRASEIIQKGFVSRVPIDVENYHQQVIYPILKLKDDYEDHFSCFSPSSASIFWKYICNDRYLSKIILSYLSIASIVSCLSL